MLYGRRKLKSTLADLTTNGASQFANLRYSDPVMPGALKNTSPLVSLTTISPVSRHVALKEIASGILSPRFGVPPSTAKM